MANKKTLLVIDDDPYCCLFLNNVLSHYGYHVLIGHTGEEGLLILEKEACDGVFVDISLPVMDGFEIAEAIRNKKGNSFPVFASSGHSLETLKQLNPHAISLFTDICEKPFGLQSIINLMHKYID